MSSKFQIFISSTFGDLEQERALVIKAVLEMGHIPVGMEMFSAADDEQWNIITNQIDSSDYYIVIVAHKYGSTLPDGTSYTEKEYEYASSKNIPVLGFVLDNTIEWPKSKSESSEIAIAKVSAFKEKIKTKLISYWRNCDDLYGKCAISLMKAFTAYPREGWVRASEVQDVAGSKELTRLSAENASLREALAIYESDKSVDNEFGKITQVFVKNNRNISVWKREGTDWEPTASHSLYTIFEKVAPLLRSKTEANDISNYIGMLVCNFPHAELRKNWPVPSNTVSEILSDFTAYDLVDSLPESKNGKTVDTVENYFLTSRGSAYLAYVKRWRLEHNAAEFDRAAAATSSKPIVEVREDTASAEDETETH